MAPIAEKHSKPSLDAKHDKEKHDTKNDDDGHTRQSRSNMSAAKLQSARTKLYYEKLGVKRARQKKLTLLNPPCLSQWTLRLPTPMPPPRFRPRSNGSVSIMCAPPQEWRLHYPINNVSCKRLVAMNVSEQTLNKILTMLESWQSTHEQVSGGKGGSEAAFLLWPEHAELLSTCVGAITDYFQFRGRPDKIARLHNLKYDLSIADYTTKLNSILEDLGSDAMECKSNLVTNANKAKRAAKERYILHRSWCERRDPMAPTKYNGLCKGRGSLLRHVENAEDLPDDPPSDTVDIDFSEVVW